MHTLHLSMKNHLRLTRIVPVALSLFSVMDFQGLQLHPLILQEPYFLLQRIDHSDQFVLLVDEVQFLIMVIRVLIDDLIPLIHQGVIQLREGLHCTLV